MSILYCVTVDVGYRSSTRDASVPDDDRLVRLQTYIGVALGPVDRGVYFSCIHPMPLSTTNECSRRRGALTWRSARGWTRI